MNKEETTAWTKELLKTFSENVKQLRSEKGLTQKDLALKTGIAQTTLSSYEGGEKNLPLANAALIAKALDVSIDKLCGLKEEKSDKITTYGDIARFLFALSETNLYFVPFLETDMYLNEPGWLRSSSITFPNDEELFNFFDSLGDMQGLYRQGTIKPSLYELWFNDQIERLDAIPLPIEAAYNPRR